MKETERVIINARTLFRLKPYLNQRIIVWDKHRLERVVNGFYNRHQCASSEYKKGSEKWKKAKEETAVAKAAIKQFGYKGDTPITAVAELKYYSVMAYDTVGTFIIHRVMLPVQAYEENEPDWSEYHYFVSYWNPSSSMFTEVFFNFDDVCRHFRHDIQNALQHDQWIKFYNKFNPYVDFTIFVHGKEKIAQRRKWKHHFILDDVIKDHYAEIWDTVEPIKIGAAHD